MMQSCDLTARQREALKLMSGPARHVMLFGGSRSGKTFLVLRTIAIRAMKAPRSRHAVLRFRFNHVKASIVLDTWPKMMQLCFPGVEWSLDKTDWYASFPNGSQVWFGGLDDKDRTEKILGQEHASIFLNECSQIPYASRNVALTRLAQRVQQRIDGMPDAALVPRMYYDCNPPSTAHWSYQLFVRHIDPETKRPISQSAHYAALQMNPEDNAQNLPPEYIATLESLPERLRKRFLRGEFSDANPNALWTSEGIDRWRVIDGGIPDLQRIVIAVDPSGADDVDNADNDEIGIVVAGLGTDGVAYVLEDLTLKAGPATWGRVVASAYERHQADLVVGERNFGGAMVQYVIQAARPRTPYKDVTASRGKVVRAEPISALAEQGKVRHVGDFRRLEDELCAMSTYGYTGQGSPNRADALVWAISELFPGVVAERKEKRKPKTYDRPPAGWMAA